MSGMTHLLVLDYVPRPKDAPIQQVELVAGDHLKLQPHELSRLSDFEKKAKKDISSSKVDEALPSLLVEKIIQSTNPFEDVKQKKKVKPKKPSVFCHTLYGTNQQSLPDYTMNFVSQGKVVHQLGLKGFGKVSVKPEPEKKEPEAPKKDGADVSAPNTDQKPESTTISPEAPATGNETKSETAESLASANISTDAATETTIGEADKTGDESQTSGSMMVEETPKVEPEPLKPRVKQLIDLERVVEVSTTELRVLRFSPVCEAAQNQAKDGDYFEPWQITVIMILPISAFAADVQEEMTIIDKYLTRTNWSGDYQEESEYFRELQGKIYDGIYYEEDDFYPQEVKPVEENATESAPQESQPTQKETKKGKKGKKKQEKQSQARKPIGAPETEMDENKDPAQQQENAPESEEATLHREALNARFRELISESKSRPTIIALCQLFSDIYYELKNPNTKWFIVEEVAQDVQRQGKKQKNRKNNKGFPEVNVQTIRYEASPEDLDRELEQLYYSFFTADREKKAYSQLSRDMGYHRAEDSLKFYLLPKAAREYLCYQTHVERTVWQRIDSMSLLDYFDLQFKSGNGDLELYCMPNTMMSIWMSNPKSDIYQQLRLWVNMANFSLFYKDSKDGSMKPKTLPLETAFKLLGVLYSIIQKQHDTASVAKDTKLFDEVVFCLRSLLFSLENQDQKAAVDVFYEKIRREFWFGAYYNIRRAFYEIPLEVVEDKPHYLRSRVDAGFLKEITDDQVIPKPDKQPMLSGYLSLPDLKDSRIVREFVLGSLRRVSPMIAFTFKEIAKTWWRREEINLEKNRVDLISKVLPLIGGENLISLLLEMHLLLSKGKESNLEIYNHCWSVVTHPKNPFFAIYQILTEDLPRALNEDLLTVKEISIDGPITSELVKKLLGTLYPETSTLLFKKRHEIKTLYIKSEVHLNRLNSLILLPQTELAKTAYLLEAKGNLERLLQRFSSYQLKELKTDQVRVDMQILDDPVWEQLPLFYNFLPIQKEVMGVVQSCHTLQALKTMFENYIASTTAKFASFADPARFPKSMWLTYFRYAHLEVKEREEQILGDSYYRFFLERLNLPEQNTTLEAILRNSSRFAALKWVEENFLSLQKFIGDKDLQLLKVQPGQKLAIIRSLYERFHELDDKKALLGMAIVLDPKCTVLDDPDYQKATNLISIIAQTPKTFKFVKEQRKEDIRAMRDDCDGVDTELVMKLDFFSVHLRKIVEYPVRLDSDVLLQTLSGMTYKDQTQLIKTALDIERMVEHLTYIFEKAKKTSNFAKKQVEMINKQSLIRISYSAQVEDFEVSATLISEHKTAGAKDEDISPLELKELFNQIRILSIGTNVDLETKREDGTVNTNFPDFIKLGDELNYLLRTVGRLRELGVMDTAFNQPVLTILKNGVDMFKVSQNHITLELRYCSSDLKRLQASNKQLSDRTDELHEKFLYEYEDWSLLTFYHGRKLYHLTEYFAGNVRDPVLREQIINQVYESIEVAELETMIIKDENTAGLSDRDFVARFERVAGLMKAKTEKVLEGLSIHKAESKDSIFSGLGKAVKVVHSAKLTLTEPKDQVHVEVSEYEWILRLLHLTGKKTQNFLRVSQILFCDDKTNNYELIAFLTRALLDPSQREYFLLNVDALQPQVLSYFKHEVDRMYRKYKDRFNSKLLVFIQHEKVFEDLKHDTNAFELLPEAIYKKVREVTLQTLTKIENYGPIFLRNKMVLSEMAGMGKTRFIEKDSRGCERVEIFLAGEISSTIITSRLNECIRQLDRSGQLALVIKLEHMDRFDELVSLIDFTLFKICFLGRISSDYGCLKFKPSLSGVYIEVGNTMQSLFRKKSMIIRLLEKAHSTDTRLVVSMRPFSLDQVNYVKTSHSEEQIALSLLRNLSSKSIGSQYATPQHPLSENEYRNSIKTYFLHKDRKESSVTYSQYTFWIKTLANLAQCLDNCKLLNPAGTASEQRLRAEVADEIRILSDQICGFTVEQAKTSQSGMLNLSTQRADSDHEFSRQMDNLKARTQSLQKWDSSRMLIPLMTEKALVLLKSADKLFANPQDVQRNNNRRECVLYLDKMAWYKETVENGVKLPKETQLLRMLAHYVGCRPEDLMQRCADFRTKGFVITFDNLMKMGLILLKSNLDVPIVLMGESGCGKSYLSEFVAVALLQDEIKTLTLYSGVTIVELLEFVADCIRRARELAVHRKKLWVFFDEFNTSALQSVVGEIMIDRRCSVGGNEIRQIPPNIVFIAACNPYRLKVKQNNIGLVPKTEDTMLSHRVFPIPERILNYIWDFGQLSDEDERKYAINIISKANLFADLPEKDRKGFQEKLATVAYNCHRNIKKSDELSAMSLRDLNRVTKTYAWFRSMYQEIDRLGIEKISDQNNRIQSTICSLMLCYGLRLNGQPERQQLFLTELCKSLKEISTFCNKKTEDILNTLPEFVEKYLFKELRSLEGMHPIIPEDVATNRPLKENFIAMLVGYDKLLPVIICGSPGTSKTLCTQILTQALSPEVKEHPRAKLFKRFKPMFSIYYGGSQTSTAEGVKLVFERGRKYLANNQSSDTPTVLFDEIGLAELSPHNPLKVLHPLLENQDRKGNEIAFIGLSNWTLDLSKMNRLIYVARADLELNDLKAIFENSISKLENTPEKERFRKALEVLAKSYFDYRKWQTDKKNSIGHRHFHGSRDIYAVAKFIYKKVQQKEVITADTIPRLIKQAIERNFSGEFYPFGFGLTETRSVPGLESEPRMSPFDRVKFSDLKSIDSIRDLCNGKSGKDEPTTFLTSAGVFKRFFWHNLNSAPIKITKQEFFTEMHTMDLVDQNLLDKQSRFLMLKSESDLVDTMLVEKLKTMVQKNPELECYKIKNETNGRDRTTSKIIDWRGVENQENSLELLSTLKTYISEGYIVIMKNLDGLYGSLYDLFNQKYTVVEDQKSCFLYYGESKQKVNVHDNFKCIVIIPASPTTASGPAKEDIELKQPAPFLNRFEKFYVRIASLLSQTSVRRLLALHQASMALAQHPKISFVGLSSELIASICITMESISSSDKQQEVSLSNAGQERIPNEHLQKVLQMSTNHIMLDSEFTKEKAELLLAAHPHKSLLELVKHCDTQMFPQWFVFTFSTTEVFQSQMNLIDKHVMNRDADKRWNPVHFEQLTKLGVEGRSQLLKNLSGNIIVHVPASSGNHFELLNQLKTTITDNREVSAMIVVVQLDREIEKLKRYSNLACVNFWNGWDNVVMDDLEYNDYSAMHDILNKPPLDLIRVDTNPFHDPVPENLLAQRIYQNTATQAMMAVAEAFDDEALLECKEFVPKLLEIHPDILVKVKLELSRMIDKQMFPSQFGLSTCQLFIKNMVLTRGKPVTKIVNIESAIQGLFRSFTIKKMGSIFEHLNHHVNNVFSYAKGCCSSDEKVSQIFRRSFEEKLASWTYEPNKVFGTNCVHLELPMLGGDPLSRELADFVRKATTKDTNLKELVFNLKADEEKMFEEENLATCEELVINIIRGQQLNFEKHFAKLHDTQETLEEYFGEKGISLEKSKCLDSLVFDTLRTAVITTPKPLYLKSMRHFAPMMAFLKSLSSNKKEQHSIQHLLYFYVYIAVGYQEGLTHLCNLASERGITLQEFLTDSKLDEESELSGITPEKQILLRKLPVKGYKMYQALSYATLSFASGISRTEMYNRLRLALNGARSSESLNLASLLILESMKDLKLDDTTLDEIKQLETIKKDLGEKAYIHRVKIELPKFLPRLNLTQNKEKLRQIVNMMCEYGYMCGLEQNLDFLLNEQCNKIFNALPVNEVEAFCNSLISGIMQAEGGLLVTIISSHEEIVKIQKTFELSLKLKRLSNALDKIRDGALSRFQIFLTLFVDRIVLERQKSRPQSKRGADIAETLKAILPIIKTEQQLPTLLTLVVVGVFRSLFTSEYFINHREMEAHEFTQVEAISRELGAMTAPELMVKTENAYLKTFFMQAAYLYGQPSTLVQHYRLLQDFLILESSAKVGAQKLCFYSEPVIEIHNDVEKRAQALLFEYERNPVGAQEFAGLLKRTSINLYAFAICLINKFVIDTSKELDQAYKDRYNGLITALQLTPQQKQFFESVIDADSFDFSEFLQDGETDIAVNLKRLFYQHLAIQVCFSNQLTANKHVTARDAQGVPQLSNTGSFATVVSERRVENLCSVLNQVTNYRLRELRWQPNGPLPEPTAHPRVGMYRCSCGYAYALSDCGFPNGRFNCAWCRHIIGGDYPVLYPRAGHYHIERFSNTQELIFQEYDLVASRYHAHRIMDIHDPSLIPLKLREVGIETYVRNYQNDQYLSFLGLKMIFRHLYDHLGLVTKRETLSEADSDAFEAALTRVVDFTRPEIAKMANRKIDSPIKYLLAHIKNDIEVLKKHLKLRNGTDTCNWVSGVLGYYVEEQLAKNPAAVNPAPEVINSILETPMGLLNHLQQLAAKMAADDLTGALGTYRMVVRNQIHGNALTKALRTMSAPSEVLALAKVLRHNYTDNEQMVAAFRDKSQNSSELVHDVVKYVELLKDFEPIVMSIWGLVKAIAKKYNNSIDFNDAGIITIEEAGDEIMQGFDTFVKMWEPKSPLQNHIMNYPEIFSFAYMCQQDLNVMEWIDRIRRNNHKTTLINFIIVNDKDYGSKELLHIKSLLRTIIGNLQNKLVVQADKILGIDDKQTERKSLLQLQREDLLQSVEIEALVSQHYWFSSEELKETTLVFDMPRIELGLAKLIKRPMFKLEENDLPHFSFRNASSEATQRKKILDQLCKQFKSKELPQEAKKELAKRDQHELQELEGVLLELANVVYAKYAFSEPTERLVTLMRMHVKDPSDLLDSQQFRELQLLHLSSFYKLCKEAQIDLNMQKFPDSRISAEMIQALGQMSQAHLNELVKEVEEAMEGYAGEQITQLLSQKIDDFVDSDSPLKKDCPQWITLCRLKFEDHKHIKAEVERRRQPH